MTKNDLINISFEENSEKELKAKLIETINLYGANKALYLLTVKNQILLSTCGIDENTFNNILFKNYILCLNNTDNKYTFSLSKKDKEKVNAFDAQISLNNIDNAFEIYGKNYVVYQLLCQVYFNNINKKNFEKINGIHDKDIDSVYDRIMLLNSANLTFKREEFKVRQRVSSK